MSADNWTHCPKCVRLGKVDPNSGVKSRIFVTLQEKYEIYMLSNGVFSVSYGAYCTNCGWEFSFDHTEQCELPKPEPIIHPVEVIQSTRQLMEYSEDDLIAALKHFGEYTEKGKDKSNALRNATMVIWMETDPSEDHQMHINVIYSALNDLKNKGWISYKTTVKVL